MFIHTFRNERQLTYSKLQTYGILWRPRIQDHAGGYW